MSESTLVKLSKLLEISCCCSFKFSACRRSISAPDVDELEDDTLLVPQDYNMAMREVCKYLVILKCCYQGKECVIFHTSI